MEDERGGRARGGEGERVAASREYAPEQDRRGRDLVPGDRVRFKLYPKGTDTGRIVISKRSRVVVPGGGTLPALAIETDDGTVYALHSGGTTKL